MPSYKLTYFPLRARAETARCLFAAAGVEYEDYRIPPPQWPELKPKTPFGSLPILEVDGKVFGQSLAVYRYLAREFGFAGKTNFEAAVVDSVGDSVNDIISQLVQARFAADDQKEQKLKDAVSALAAALVTLENILSNNNGGDGYFVGDSMTWADVHFMTTCDYVLQADVSALEKFPNLAALNDRVRADEKISAWIKKRPTTEL